MEVSRLIVSAGAWVFVLAWPMLCYRRRFLAPFAAGAAVAFALLSPGWMRLVTFHSELVAPLALFVLGLYFLDRYRRMESTSLGVFGFVSMVGAIFIGRDSHLLIPLLAPSVFVTLRGRRWPLGQTLVLSGLPLLGFFWWEVAHVSSLDWIASFWTARAEAWHHPLLFLPFLAGCFRWRQEWHLHPLYVFLLMFPAYLLLQFHEGTYREEGAFFALFPVFAILGRGWTEEESPQARGIWNTLLALSFVVALFASCYEYVQSA